MNIKIIGWLITTVRRQDAWSKALNHAKKGCNVTFGWIFIAFAACMTGVAATSYSLNHTVYAIHWAFAIALTMCILIAIFWLIRQGDLMRSDYILVVLIVATVAMSALPIIHNIPLVKFYVPRELLVFICSLWLLGQAAYRLSAEAEATT